MNIFVDNIIYFYYFYSVQSFSHACFSCSLIRRGIIPLFIYLEMLCIDILFLSLSYEMN